MKQWGINHYHTFSIQKAAVVERWNGTLRRKLWKEFTARNTMTWLGDAKPRLLDKIVKEYNEKTKHRTIGMTPYEAWLREGEVKKVHSKRWVKTKQTMKNKRQLKRGDYVRVSRSLGLFQKSYTGNWSEELFKIVKVRSSYKPEAYELVDTLGEPVKGTFYRAELQPTKLPIDFARVEKVLERKTDPKTKKTLIKVKWKGYDNRFNSWIEESQSLKL